jgi:hypothetical protein
VEIIFFGQEMFLDYFDYHKPLHSRTEVIHIFSLWDPFIGLSVYGSKKAEIDAEINTVELSDNPF